MPTEEQKEAFTKKCEALTEDDWDFIRTELDKDCPGLLEIPHYLCAIFVEIFRERDAQDAQWGGAIHDNLHTQSEWYDLIERYNLRAYNSQYHSPLGGRGQRHRGDGGIPEHTPRRPHARQLSRHARRRWRCALQSTGHGHLGYRRNIQSLGKRVRHE